MTRSETLAHINRCLAIIASSEPMTDAERAEHLSRVAAEKNRGTAPHPQSRLI